MINKMVVRSVSSTNSYCIMGVFTETYIDSEKVTHASERVKYYTHNHPMLCIGSLFMQPAYHHVMLHCNWFLFLTVPKGSCTSSSGIWDNKLSVSFIYQ